jgi:hypothetical protein
VKEEQLSDGGEEEEEMDDQLFEDPDGWVHLFVIFGTYLHF